MKIEAVQNNATGRTMQVLFTARDFPDERALSGMSAIMQVGGEIEFHCKSGKRRGKFTIRINETWKQTE